LEKNGDFSSKSVSVITMTASPLLPADSSASATSQFLRSQSQTAVISGTNKIELFSQVRSDFGELGEGSLEVFDLF
jgi:hypothetical protein